MSNEITIKCVENGFYIMLGHYNRGDWPKQYIAKDIPELENVVGDLAVILQDEYEKNNETKANR
jgi:hypothetical protein